MSVRAARIARAQERVRGWLAPDPARFFAAAAVAAVIVAFISAAAGFAQILPVLLDPDVPTRAARPFVFGLLSLSLEVGALVGWPLGWTEAALRSRERGEARARMALGEAPVTRVSRLWAAAAVLAVSTAASSLAWGRDARAPGRVARALIEEARRACEGLPPGSAPRIASVPLVRASWICVPGRPPLLVGEGMGRAAGVDFVASSFAPADDLSSVVARDVQIVLPTEAIARARFGEVRITGLVPFTAPSSVPAGLRTTVIVLAAAVSAVLATISALRGEARARAAAWVVAILGPAAALASLRACERAGLGDARLLVVAIAAAAATLLARATVVLASALVRHRRAR